MNRWVFVDQKGCRLTTFFSKHLFVMYQFLIVSQVHRAGSPTEKSRGAKSQTCFPSVSFADVFSTL